MAKVTFNSSVAGVRGKVDRWIFREQNGTTVVVPFRQRPDKPSATQLDRRRRFKEAQAYAAAVLSDPLKRECYRMLGAARKCPPNALLISNFLNPPTIDHVECAGLKGQPGDSVRVIASDAIEVTGVTITLRRQDGGAIESGEATRDHDLWVYRCASACSGEMPLQIEIAARNRAGAVGTLTVRVP